MGASTRRRRADRHRPQRQRGLARGRRRQPPVRSSRRPVPRPGRAGAEFEAAGVPRADVPELVHRAATEGRYTGYLQGGAAGRPIYDRVPGAAALRGRYGRAQRVHRGRRPAQSGQPVPGGPRRSAVHRRPEPSRLGAMSVPNPREQVVRVRLRRSGTGSTRCGCGPRTTRSRRTSRPVSWSGSVRPLRRHRRLGRGVPGDVPAGRPDGVRVPDGIVAERWDQRGQELARRLARELGPGVAVEFAGRHGVIGVEPA